MRVLKFLPWLAVGALLILHGIAHLPGILGSMNLVTFEEASRQPNIWLTGAGNVTIFVLGLVWLVAAISFVVAGVGVIRQAAWWPLATAVAVVISLPVTILWKNDAVIGLVLNFALLVGIIVWFGFLNSLLRRQPA